MLTFIKKFISGLKSEIAQAQFIFAVTKSLKNFSSSGPKPLAELSKNLSEYEIPRSQTIAPDGTIVKSLFMDHVPDKDYILGKIIKRAKKLHEDELKKREVSPDNPDSTFPPPPKQLIGLN